MNNQLQLASALIVILSMGLLSCSGSKELTKDGFRKSSANISEIVSQLPDYDTSLSSLKGKGRAIVSEPGNTERVTIEFSSNRSKSLLTVRNGIGIEGGELLTDGDTLLVYNKLDKFVRKIPVKGGQLNRINKLASLNILDMISYSVSADDIMHIWENESLYKLQLSSGTEVLIEKKELVIREILQPENSALPYSKITYDAYGSVRGFILPRRISIFGAEKQSKVALQLTTLDLNPQLGSLKISYPNDIPIYYQ